MKQVSAFCRRIGRPRERVNINVNFDGRRGWTASSIAPGRSACERLASYKIPGTLILIDAIPRNLGGQDRQDGVAGAGCRGGAAGWWG